VHLANLGLASHLLADNHGTHVSEMHGSRRTFSESVKEWSPALKRDAYYENRLGLYKTLTIQKALDKAE
jgi:hypothetical protein